MSIVMVAHIVTLVVWEWLGVHRHNVLGVRIDHDHACPFIGCVEREVVRIGGSQVGVAALAQVHQREIVEVPFTLPDGQILSHPALVLSCDDLQSVEPGMFYAVLISSKNHYPWHEMPGDEEIDGLFATN